MTKQNNALRLAEQYDYGDPVAHSNMWKAAVCNELRRQHARIAELEAELEAVGAGGVQALSTVQQPVVRDPLTANQVSGLAESAGYWHGDRSRADFINGIRYAEAAHGIKQGGQHGTDN